MVQRDAAPFGATPAPLHPVNIREPMGPDDLAPLFPMALIGQEVTSNTLQHVRIARFKAGRRQEIEQDCLDSFGKKSLRDQNDPDYKKRPPKSILIATQVVEQSLDLDFDIMISAIALSTCYYNE